MAEQELGVRQVVQTGGRNQEDINSGPLKVRTDHLWPSNLVLDAPHTGANDVGAHADLRVEITFPLA
jgi:hypothetical protein